MAEAASMCAHWCLVRACLRAMRSALQVKDARTEANSNVVQLEPLRPHLLALTSDDFASLPQRFGPLMHTVMLIWKHSRHYNSAARLVVLLRQICNDVIVAAYSSLRRGGQGRGWRGGWTAGSRPPAAAAGRPYAPARSVCM